MNRAAEWWLYSWLSLSPTQGIHTSNAQIMVQTQRRFNLSVQNTRFIMLSDYAISKSFKCHCPLAGTFFSVKPPQAEEADNKQIGLLFFPRDEPDIPTMPPASPLSAGSRGEDHNEYVPWVFLMNTVDCYKGHVWSGRLLPWGSRSAVSQSGSAGVNYSYLITSYSPSAVCHELTDVWET